MADFGGAASGAASGALAGSAFGPWGAAAGGVIGGVAGLFGNKKKKKLSSFDKRQKKLNEQQHNAILGEGPLADLYNYNPEAANDVFNKNTARPAQRNFAETTVPTITGAFRSNGLQNSSYVGDALSKAGRDVQENLDALRAQYLYGEQNNAREAKRTAVENLQNRSTFAYNQAAGTGGGGFDINKILGSITPEMTDKLRDYFKKNPAAAGSVTPNATTPPIR
jgi:hypothetical protein